MPVLEIDDAQPSHAKRDPVLAENRYSAVVGPTVTQTLYHRFDGIELTGVTNYRGNATDGSSPPTAPSAATAPNKNHTSVLTAAL